MRKALPWIFGVAFALFIVALILFGRGERQAYRTVEGAIEQQVEIRQERIDLVVEMATASVDRMVVMAGNLPSQQAEADLIKQDIEEIGRRLKEAAEAQGELAIAKLDQSIEQFNQTMERVDDASKKAENPEVKSTLDRIYGALESVKEMIIKATTLTQG